MQLQQITLQWLQIPKLAKEKEEFRMGVEKVVIHSRPLMFTNKRQPQQLSLHEAARTKWACLPCPPTSPSSLHNVRFPASKKAPTCSPTKCPSSSAHTTTHPCVTLGSLACFCFHESDLLICPHWRGPLLSWQRPMNVPTHTIFSFSIPLAFSCYSG